VAAFDFVTLGETMIRLSPPLFQTIEQATSLDMCIGGSESNTAIALSRFGLRTAWVSKLLDDPLGRKISSSIAAHGVDTSGIVWAKEGRNATYFIEFGRPPRPHRVTYDRKNSAINTLKPSEVDWSLFKGARVVHLTGITAALSPTCRTLVEMAVRRAKRAGSLVSFDINYRAKLWSAARARRVLSPICADVDILIVSDADAANVLGAKGAPEEIAAALATRFGCATVLVTLTGGGGVCGHKGKTFRSAPIPAQEVDRVGAGDAFTAGFLYGYVTRDVEYGLAFATATAALKFTIPGDPAWLTRADVEAVLSAGSTNIQR
jgi:2-dehydro-3-deoxygluconokinase